MTHQRPLADKDGRRGRGKWGRGRKRQKWTRAKPSPKTKQNPRLRAEMLQATTTTTSLACCDERVLLLSFCACFVVVAVCHLPINKKIDTFIWKSSRTKQNNTLQFRICHALTEFAARQRVIERGGERGQITRQIDSQRDVLRLPACVYVCVCVFACRLPKLTSECGICNRCISCDNDGASHPNWPIDSSNSNSNFRIVS